MNNETVAISLRRYLELCRYIGQLEGSLTACRAVFKDNEQIEWEAVDELLEWRPDVASFHVVPKTGEDDG